ncbi:hypothetical protein NX722_24485 [Endozoicomonas gorgoniicola]|uniref:Uncharacterized protein n=1 Tax=Endozoicomonas gorgoniicola TaxID=1234144 RepID=A0ABT3N268_9GAMM|nr:hypothetical protein [Endozoicomonas gorgoniicola]MCW7555728.1 hypothetical protein [Endozoicomonas gorgoniicola]
MGLEQRVEALEIWKDRMEVVIRGTHDVVCLILKEQRQFERELCDIKRKQAEHDERFDKMDKKFERIDDRFDKLERLIVSSLLEKTEGAEKKDLT